MSMTARAARSLEVGTVYSSECQQAITRVQIAWYMVASYDLNPIHVDEPFAREAGFGTVIGQGMLPLGFLSRQLVAAAGHHRIRRLKGDFVGSVLPGDVLVTELTVAGRRELDGGVEIEWAMAARGQDDKLRVRGSAVTWHEDETETR
jgi:acyl dehydratase